MSYLPSNASRWRQDGRISLWQYTEHQRNFSGWHLNADDAGCRSLLLLIDALLLDGSGHRILNVTAPTGAQLRVPNNRGGLAPWVAPERWRLTLSGNADSWHCPRDIDPASLTVGLDMLVELRDGVAGIADGRGDHSIGHGKDEFGLWFWWSPAAVK